jgi:predicted permease
VLLARLSLDLIVANLPIRLPDNAPVTVNATVLLLTAAILAPTTLLFGLLPALRLSHVRIGSVLARGRTQVGTSLSRRGGQALMAAEIALAVILVAGAGLMIRSLLRIWAVDLGFTADGLVTMEVLPLDREAAARKVFYRALLDRLRTLPGVASAGIVDNFALGSGTSYTEVRAGAEAVFITQYQVLPGYFETIGARLRDGRLPNDGDYDSGFRGAVLSESAAAAMFPDGPAVGRRFEHDGLRGGGWTVLGVIADLRHRGPLNSRRAEHARQVFLPLEPREDDRLRAMTAIVRLSAAGPGIGGLLREAAQAVGPRVLIERIRTADEMFGELVITPRRQAALLGLLGALGLTLALVGVFGMTAYAVARRTGEIGVRMAFGARADQVVGTILRDSAPPIAAGVLFGVGGAVMTTRVIESFLFETAPRDPLTLAVVAVTLAAAGCLAALVPALRAVKVDPVACLRAE